MKNSSDILAVMLIVVQEFFLGDGGNLATEVAQQWNFVPD